MRKKPYIYTCVFRIYIYICVCVCVCIYIYIATVMLLRTGLPQHEKGHSSTSTLVYIHGLAIYHYLSIYLSTYLSIYLLIDRSIGRQGLWILPTRLIVPCHWRLVAVAAIGSARPPGHSRIVKVQQLGCSQFPRHGGCAPFYGCVRRTSQVLILGSYSWTALQIWLVTCHLLMPAPFQLLVKTASSMPAKPSGESNNAWVI